MDHRSVIPIVDEVALPVISFYDLWLIECGPRAASVEREDAGR